MADEIVLHPLRGDLDHCEGKVPTAAEMADAFANVTTALAPLIEGLRQFGAQIGALGRAYCEVIETFGQRMAEDSWTWSADAARRRPESEPGEPATSPAGIR